MPKHWPAKKTPCGTLSMAHAVALQQAGIEETVGS